MTKNMRTSRQTLIRRLIAVTAVAAAALLVPPMAGAEEFFVSPQGSAGEGTSWASAWKEPGMIDWSRIGPGDIVYLDGGAEGETYWTGLEIAGRGGTETEPVVITRSTEPGRDGAVRLRSSVTVKAPNVIIDGLDRDKFRIETDYGFSGYIVNVATSAKNFVLKSATVEGKYGGEYGSSVSIFSPSATIAYCRLIGSSLEDQLKINSAGSFLIEGTEFIDLEKQGTKHADMVQVRAVNYSLTVRDCTFEPKDRRVQIFQIQTPNGGDVGDLIFDRNVFIGPAHVAIHLKNNITRLGRFEVSNNIFYRVPAITGKFSTRARIDNNRSSPGGPVPTPMPRQSE